MEKSGSKLRKPPWQLVRDELGRGVPGALGVNSQALGVRVKQVQGVGRFKR